MLLKYKNRYTGYLIVDMEKSEQNSNSVGISDKGASIQLLRVKGIMEIQSSALGL